MKNNDIITKTGTKNTAPAKREGYHKKKQPVPSLPIEKATAAKRFQDSLNRAFVKIMFDNGLSAEEMADRLYPCVSESSVVYRIIAKTNPNVKSKGNRNVTMKILAALRYEFGLDINQVVDELLEKVLGTKKNP